VVLVVALVVVMLLVVVLVGASVGGRVVVSSGDSPQNVSQLSKSDSVGAERKPTSPPQIIRETVLD